MKEFISSSWIQKAFYIFTFTVGFFFQPNWFYTNIYEADFWGDKSWVVNPYLIYSIFSGLVTSLAMLFFARFAKRYL